MVVDVDEPGGNDQAPRFNDSVAGRIRKVADPGNSVPTEANVGYEAVATGTVDHQTIAYQDVERILGETNGPRHHKGKAKAGTSTDSPALHFRFVAPAILRCKPVGLPFLPPLGHAAKTGGSATGSGAADLNGRYRKCHCAPRTEWRRWPGG